ncbi:MAG: SIMPL domain-containing protein, partial [Anaerolineae bacterium]|nr:SIMPL domain-containing protein [Anaerolineae bacterium]
IYPEDPTDPQSGQPTGDRIYHVQLAVTVTIRDISKVGAVIQAGLGAGANDLNSLSFGIADSKSLEASARKAAVADALDRAKQLAEAAGVTLGTPLSISESIGSVPVPMFNRANDMVAAAAPPQINAGQLSVSITVNITYSIGG